MALRRRSGLPGPRHAAPRPGHPRHIHDPRRARAHQPAPADRPWRRRPVTAVLLVLALVGALTLSAKAIDPSSPEPHPRPRPCSGPEPKPTRTRRRPSWRPPVSWRRQSDASWPSGTASSPGAEASAAPAANLADGRTPLISFGGGGDLRKVAAGAEGRVPDLACPGGPRPGAAGAAALRLGHGQRVDGGPDGLWAVFVAAWRHVHDLFAAQGRPPPGCGRPTPRRSPAPRRRRPVLAGRRLRRLGGGRRLQSEHLRRRIGLDRVRRDLQGVLRLGVGQEQAADDLGDRHRRGPRRPGRARCPGTCGRPPPWRRRCRASGRSSTSTRVGAATGAPTRRPSPWRVSSASPATRSSAGPPGPPAPPTTARPTTTTVAVTTTTVAPTTTRAPTTTTHRPPGRRPPPPSCDGQRGGGHRHRRRRPDGGERPRGRHDLRRQGRYPPAELQRPAQVRRQVLRGAGRGAGRRTQPAVRVLRPGHQRDPGLHHGAELQHGQATGSDPAGHAMPAVGWCATSRPCATTGPA